MLARMLLAAVMVVIASGRLDGQGRGRTPVLVELFTSEGCSSCPPADALLARLDREQPVAGAEVIVLGEHVDYWDRLGWRDRFSSPRWTERQNGYGTRFHLADVYTPQMVVGGRAELNGADAGAAARAIAQAARTPGLTLVVKDARIDGEQLTASISLGAGSSEAAELFAAVVSPVESTQVRAGENGGRTLHHVGVVRSLRRIGTLRDLVGGPLAIRLELPAAERGVRLVVFAQAAGFGPVLGAVSVDVSSFSATGAARAGN